MLISSNPNVKYLARAALVALCLTLVAPALAVDTSGSGSGGSSDSSSGSGSGSGSESTVSLADAKSYIRRESWPQAVAALKLLIAARPNDADALNLMGYSLRKGGDTKNALGFYLRALKLKPKHRGANEYLGELYVETGQLAKAQERLQVLEGICGKGCEEYLDLKEAIDKAS